MNLVGDETSSIWYRLTQRIGLYLAYSGTLTRNIIRTTLLRRVNMFVYDGISYTIF